MDWLVKRYLEFCNASVPETVCLCLDLCHCSAKMVMTRHRRNFNCLVAEVDGKMVGLTHYLSHRYAWKIEEVIYLQDLYVDPAVRRGTGAGRALIEAVCAVGRRCN